MIKSTFLKFALIALLLLPGMRQAQAVTSYVADTIEITLRTGPSNSHKVMRMLQTDEPLEILEEQENWLLVRTKNGDQGWVSKRYISQDLPKSVQIQKLTKRAEQLESLSGGAAGQIDALEKENSSSKEALANIQKEYQQLKEKYSELESDAANVLTLKEEYAEAQEKLKNANAELERFSIENNELRASSQMKWFLTGAGVVSIAWLVGYLMGRSRARQQKLY